MAKLVPKENFVVHPCASGFGGEYYPAVGIDFQREDGTTGSAYRNLRDRAACSSLEAAMDAARRIQVESIDEDGVVRFVP